MKGVTVIEHPVVHHYLTRIRDRRTAMEDVRRLVTDAASLMAFEATRSLPTKISSIQTPLTRAEGCCLEYELVLVPILRAGLGLMEGFLRVVPFARVGFIGIKRNEETLEPMGYHQSLPAQLDACEVIVLDPMLATGGSTCAALDLVKKHGARRIRTVHLLAAPEGIRKVRRKHPDVPIFTAAIDRHLNDKGYIVPGLGDAGDRLFGT